VFSIPHAFVVAAYAAADELMALPLLLLRC
jgi:hypothetical protein